MKLLFLLLAAAALIFAPHLVAAVVAAVVVPLGAAVVWAGAQPAVLGGLIGVAARTHLRRRFSRH